MVASIGAVASPSQGASYYERDGYYARDDPEHHAASAWVGRGAAELGLDGPVDPDTFKAVLEGEVPDGSGRRLGRKTRDGEIHHRPGRDLTFSAPKSVSLAALVGGDARIVDAHDRAVTRALGWFERNAAETRVQNPATGRMIRVRDQKTVIATFRHDTSRNLDPALHTHSVITNMVRGEDGKWRTMANESLYASKMLLGAMYRSELAGGLAKLGYGIEKTHSDGRFEIAGVSREAVEAFSTRRAEIEAAMEGRGLGATAGNQHLARRAALMTRAHKRDVDKETLRETWAGQTDELGFDAKALVAGSDGTGRGRSRAGARRREGAGQGGTGAAAGGSVRACGASRPRARGGGLGGRASLRARRGVLRDRSARGRARLQPWRGADRGDRAGGRRSHHRRHYRRHVQRQQQHRRRGRHDRYRHRRRHRHAASVAVTGFDTAKTNPVTVNGDDVMTDAGTMLHKMNARVLPLVNRRERKTMRGRSGGAAAQRGAAGDARREGECCRGSRSEPATKKGPRRPEATRPVKALRTRPRFSAPECPARGPCRRGSR